MMQIRRWFDTVLAVIWLRAGTARRVLFGPYRGLTFGLSEPMTTRRSVFYRAYEPNVRAILQATVQPGMTVYVIGAHVGLHALYIAKLLGGRGRVVAFEGWKTNYEGLVWNVNLNRQLGVDIVSLNVAVARQSGQVLMEQGGSDGKHHLTGSAGGHTIEVEAVSLDAFYAQQPAGPDLLLIDIEGYELDALQGGEQMIAACKPVLILEHHERQSELRAWLQSHNYDLDSEDRRHLLATSRR